MTGALTIAVARKFWWAPIMLALAIWGARLDRLRAGYRTDLIAERAARQLDAAKGAAALARTEAGYAAQGRDAALTYADRLASREPLILRSTNTVRDYAQTDAGRVLCRAADRVRAIDTLDADLARDPRATGSGGRAVPTDAAAPPAGR